MNVDDSDGASIVFRRDRSSGVPPYLQLVQQVKDALRLGHLQLGDRLPTVRDVAAQLAVNPNTVLKAYRQLDAERLVESRPGLGIFVAATLEGPGLREQAKLRRELERWLDHAAAIGLDEQAIAALFGETSRNWKRAAA